jgi:hypothetical protein
VQRRIKGFFYSVAQVAYQAHVMAVYGDLYTHFAFLDFDEFIDLSNYDWSLHSLLSIYPANEFGEVRLDMIAAETGGSLDGVQGGAIGGLEYFIQHPMRHAKKRDYEMSIRSKFIASTSNPRCRLSGPPLLLGRRAPQGSSFHYGFTERQHRRCNP